MIKEFLEIQENKSLFDGISFVDMGWPVVGGSILANCGTMSFTAANNTTDDPHYLGTIMIIAMIHSNCNLGLFSDNNTDGRHSFYQLNNLEIEIPFLKNHTAKFKIGDLVPNFNYRGDEKRIFVGWAYLHKDKYIFNTKKGEDYRNKLRNFYLYLKDQKVAVNKLPSQEALEAFDRFYIDSKEKKAKVAFSSL